MASPAANRRAAQNLVRWRWFTKEVSDRLSMTMRDRVRVATEYLKSKVVTNISRPVTKRKGPRSKRIVVSDRSRPGEFPKADTARLMRDIFGDVRETSPGVWDGFVGTTLDYGLILETRLERSFLVRTLNEERESIARVLSGPLKG
jgi:hypothetical protein